MLSRLLNPAPAAVVSPAGAVRFSIQKVGNFKVKTALPIADKAVSPSNSIYFLIFFLPRYNKQGKSY